MNSINRIQVWGFKSIGDVQTMELRPLTLLAGANSSGKSSLIQPLLLMKQTLEASYDPGALLLHGPNVKFTSVEQLLARRPGGERADEFSVGVAVGAGSGLTTTFGRGSTNGLDIR